MNKQKRLSEVAKKICLPLFDISPINFFGVMEIHDNGLIRTINTDTGFYNALLDIEYTDLFYRVLQSIGCLKPGRYLSDLSPNPALSNTLFEKFQYRHILWMVESEKTIKKMSLTKIFIYGARPENDSVNQFYINHFSFLTQFNNFFLHKFLPYKKNLKSELIDDTKRADFDAIIKNGREEKNATLNKFVAFWCKYHLDKKLNKCPITRDEWHVIYWYLQGKTSEETSIILNVSLRTVEYHFEQLRKKLNSSSKAQVITKLLVHEKETMMSLIHYEPSN